MTDQVIEKYNQLNARLRSISQTNKFHLLTTCVALVILLTVCLYCCIRATSVQMHNGDQFISVAIFSPEYSEGTPMIAQGHTNILKIPILLLQALLPQEELLYAIVNTLFVFTSFVLWSYLISRIFGREILPLSALTFAAVLMNSPEMAINMSMVTIRHIEYPLALLFAIFFIKLPAITTKKVKIYTFFMVLFLSLLILNDHYFIYTLVMPLALVLIMRVKTHGPRSPALGKSIIILILGTGVAGGLGKLLSMAGIISIVPGYAEGTTVIQLESLFPSVLLALRQTLDLFGSLIFGQELRKANVSIGLMLVVFAAAIIAVIKTIQHAKKPGSSEVHAFLLFTLLFVYTAYIVPGFASPSNSRYITLAIYILVTFFAYYITKESKRLPLLAPATALLLIVASLLAMPRINTYYDNTLFQVNRDRERTQSTVSALKENNVDVVVAGGGHFSLWFESGGEIPVTQMEGKCNTPSTWANNSIWLRPSGDRKRSAFLVDTTYPELASNQCTIGKIKEIYGYPEKIIPVSKPDELAKDTSTYLLIYSYDIRTRLVATQIP